MQALEFAGKEAKSLKHREVGPEHLLLGLVREPGGVAGRVLRNLGVDIEAVRERVLKSLDPNE
jgi:ATP-dependent Clp protease ATP-binding subunit ClpC